MSPEKHTMTTVAIFGGNAVSGRALEILLSGADYEVRFLENSAVYEPAELLARANLVLLGPGLHAGCRDAFLTSLKSTLAAAEVPVLELVAARDGTRKEQARQVLWPCSTQELQREIEAALRHEAAEPASREASYSRCL